MAWCTVYTFLFLYVFSVHQAFKTQHQASSKAGHNKSFLMLTLLKTWPVFCSRFAKLLSWLNCIRVYHLSKRVDSTVSLKSFCSDQEDFARICKKPLTIYRKLFGYETSILNTWWGFFNSKECQLQIWAKIKSKF